MHGIILGLWACLLLVGCSGTGGTSSDRTALASYQTFGFAPVRGARDSRVSSMIRSEVAAQMRARGYRESSNPDLLVSISVETERRVHAKVRSTGFAAAHVQILENHYNDYGRHSEVIDEYTEGQLHINLLDMRQRRVVWSGATSGKVTRKMMANPQPALAKAVHRAFRRFP